MLADDLEWLRCSGIHLRELRMMNSVSMVEIY
jgi:hypothetical protein